MKKLIDAEPILNAIDILSGKYGIQADACLKSIKTFIDAATDAQVNVPSEDCTHEHTEFKQIRCNVCSDCGNIVEVDV